MRRSHLILLGVIVCGTCYGQRSLSLEECRRMALEANRNLQIARENVEIASRMKKAAFTQFLPNFSANGAYMWNQKNISLLAEDAHLPVGTIMPDGSFGFTQDQVNNQWAVVNGTPVPLDGDGRPFDPKVNPEKIEWKGHALLPKEAMEFDVKNVFAGTIGFTQPVYMGGKIRQLNKLAGYGKDLAGIMLDEQTTDILVEVDEAYWRVVSIEAKADLAKEYHALLTRVHGDVEAMLEEGVATRADMLRVRVRLNEAQLSLTRAENGLSLSRMALNQLCGLPLDGRFELADHDAGEYVYIPQEISVEQAVGNRNEIKALEQAVNIAGANIKLAYSRFMPNVALTAGYMVSNPNVFNGFSTTFSGMYNVGVVVNVPLFHFGERQHTLATAKARSRIAGYRMDEAREKIELQISQSTLRMNESLRKQRATQENISSAEENLRIAEEGFAEGVISSTDLLGAQSAWLAARSDNIDANIDVRLCSLYLGKALGNLELK